MDELRGIARNCAKRKKRMTKKEKPKSQELLKIIFFLQNLGKKNGKKDK